MLENGTEVLIFNKIAGMPNDTNFIKGKVIDTKQIDYVNKNKELLKKNIYVVQDENNNIYTTFYGDNYNGYYIRTIEDYLNHIKKLISSNEAVINELSSYNHSLKDIAYYLLQEKDSKTK